MERRLQHLRQVLRLEWGELAEKLDLSRAMLDFVRKGQRNLSFKALNRLEEVEREAGIAIPAPATSVTRHVPPDTPPSASFSSLSHKEKDQILARLAKMETDIQAIREAVKGL